jgi:flavin reductase (DIM6/NTAB) family NADH-FMN oxidoreductase RutF
LQGGDIMEIALKGFHEILAPRIAVLVSTIDKDGNPNAAPYSLAGPLSFDPPLAYFSAAPKRHTLANVRETGEFVLNIAPEDVLDRLWICSRPFPKGVSEISEAGLTARQSRKVKPPSIEECAGWIECKLEFEKETGDHILVVGRVVHAECRDEFTKGNELDVSRARPLMHIRGKRFVVAERVVLAKDVD